MFYKNELKLALIQYRIKPFKISFILKYVSLNYCAKFTVLYRCVNYNPSMFFLLLETFQYNVISEEECIHNVTHLFALD
jgi:hypothetical protein